MRQARQFAKHCIQEGLVACISLQPNIESHFVWKKKARTSKEVLALGKTTRSGFLKLKKEIKKIHPYEVPELISIKIDKAHEPYLAWVKAQVRS